MTGLELHKGQGGMASIAPLALVPLQKFSKDFPIEVPFAKRKWPCPLKDKIPGLQKEKLHHHT